MKKTLPETLLSYTTAQSFAGGEKTRRLLIKRNVLTKEGHLGFLQGEPSAKLRIKLSSMGISYITRINSEISGFLLFLQRCVRFRYIFGKYEFK